MTTNPFEYTTDPELHSIFNRMLDLKSRVNASFERAEKIAGFTENMAFQKPTAASVYPFFINYRELYSPSSWGYKPKKSLADIDVLVKASIKLAQEHLTEIEKLNEPSENHNNKIEKQVIEIMTRLGVPSSYTTYEYPSSRSKTKKSVYHSAGYLSDLSRVCPTSNVSSEKSKLNIYVDDYNRWAADQEVFLKKKQITDDEEAVKQNVLGNPVLVALLMQAGVNVLLEIQQASPGKKLEVIKYSMAQAISLEQTKANPNQELINDLLNYEL